MMKSIPTGHLPYEIVDKLPKKGEENKIYGVRTDIKGLYSNCIDYRYHNGEWQEVDLSVQVFGFQFEDYQESVNKVIADFEARIEAIESGSVTITMVEGSEVK